MRPYLAELLGTALLILIGCGAVILQEVVLVFWYSGSFLVLGLAIVAYITDGISGAHINPAVTIAPSSFRKIFLE